MFDPRSEAREFFAESAAAAIAEACSFFGCSEADLTTGSPRDAAGLGDRTLIVAVPSAARRAGASADRDRDRGRGPRDSRGYDRGAPRERRGRSESRERSPRGGRRERDDRGGRRRPHRGDEREESRERGEAAAPAPAEPSLGAPRGELGAIGEFVRGALERMELGPFQIGQRAEQGLDVILLEGPAARALAAGGGRAVEALQLLANQAARVQSEQAGPGLAGADGPPRRVVLDVEGDREKRQDYLARLAERASERARSTGRSVALDPMNSQDRRSIHEALRDTPGIATTSIGEGAYRQVLVVPEAAPEFPDARTRSESLPPA